MHQKSWHFLDFLKIVLGTACFTLGFNLFLVPNDLNAGGISGLSMVLVKLFHFSSIGTLVTIINIPLFILGSLTVGKKFLINSIIGTLLLSVFLELSAALPHPEADPLIGALYGGVLTGLGLGLVFASGGSTGGSDIIVRMLKLRWHNVPIGVINMGFDATIALLTGIVFGDITKALYSGICIFLCGQMVDLVVYRFDYSKVALIISKNHAHIAQQIGDQLHRGSTYLHAEGAYGHQETKVILTAVKKHQLAELKSLVTECDPDAFVIIQEAHQVLGDGFAKHTKDAL